MSRDRFNPAQFYEIRLDHKLKKDGVNLPYAYLTPEGAKLIAAYYKSKYETVIQIVDPDLKSQADFRSALAADLKKRIDKIPKEEDEYRETFIYDKRWHRFPITYLRKGEQEGFYIDDSLGTASSKDLMELAAEIVKLLHKPVYITYTGRQVAEYGCFVESIVSGINFTGKDPITKEYFISDPLTKLAQGSITYSDRENVFLVMKKLASERQKKTAQSKHYLADYEDKTSDEIVHIHKGTPEKLADHRARYELKGVDVYNEDENEWLFNKNIPSYLRLKSLKWIHIIEIQFRLEDLQKRLGPSWNESLRTEFIIQAKKIIKDKEEKLKNPLLFEFTEEFYKKHHKPVVAAFFTQSASPSVEDELKAKPIILKPNQHSEDD